jgi:circadian clock protein KaiC
VAAHFVDAACRRNERCLFFAFEESPRQICRNMRSIGIDLDPWVDAGLLRFQAARPTYGGIEQHLAVTLKCISNFRPSVVVVDPVTNLIAVGSLHEVRSMLTRLVDFLKTSEITAVFSSLTAGGGPLEAGEESVSSLMDAWLRLESIAAGGERNRTLYVLKSRGMEHSNQIREFVITDHGLQLPDAYLGPEGVLTGSARLSQEAREKAAATARRQETEGQRSELERKRQIFEARMAMLQSEFDMEQEKIKQSLAELESVENRLSEDRERMVRSRQADPASKQRDGRAQTARVR